MILAKVVSIWKMSLKIYNHQETIITNIFPKNKTIQKIQIFKEMMMIKLILKNLIEFRQNNLIHQLNNVKIT